MGFSITITGKDGTDLLKKYDVPSSLLNVSTDRDTYNYPPNTLSDIRSCFQDRFKIEYIVRTVKRMILDNIDWLNPDHGCPDCQCKPEEPEGWNLPMAKRFLEMLSTEEITDIQGGW